jgi:hypothetical protein
MIIDEFIDIPLLLMIDNNNEQNFMVINGDWFPKLAKVKNFGGRWYWTQLIIEKDRQCRHNCWCWWLMIILIDKYWK